MEEKRSKVHPDRLRLLRSEDSIYTICCIQDNCTCDKSREGCQKGFFSLFIQAIYGIEFAENQEIPWYVDFADKPYLFSDPDKFEGDKNFWNYFFYQPLTVQDVATKRKILTINTETHPLRIWNKKHYRRLGECLREKVKFKNELANHLQKKNELFDKLTVLGVQIRSTDHTSEVEPVKLSVFLKEIHKRIAKFDKIFISTDDSRILDQLIRKFGENKIIFNKVKRSGDQKPVHTNRDYKNRYDLGLEVLEDCYCLSLCNTALLVHSNISYSALLFNPELHYKLLETRKTRYKRLKTSLLFHLNRLGIRKW